MPNTVLQSQSLHDFRDPPLNEVVLGVQFATPEGYQQIYAGEVWKLFRDKYPVTQELPQLEPTFEVFGLQDERSKAPGLHIITGASHDRFWFLNPAGNELIQFQQDRLLHNWRKVDGQEISYPRFETIIRSFRYELEQLENFVATLLPQTLAINQCEISYVNHITASSVEDLKASNWLRFATFGEQEPDDFSFKFRKIVYDDDKKFQGRFIFEASSGVKADVPVIAMTLSVRGAPKKGNIDSSIEFMTKGRELIARRFVAFTTDYAHQKWGRNK